MWSVSRNEGSGEFTGYSLEMKKRIMAVLVRAYLGTVFEHAREFRVPHVRDLGGSGLWLRVKHLAHSGF